jgi:Big-like domain-containing protein
VAQQFNAIYTPTQVQLVAPNTAVAVSPSSGSHVQGTAILAVVSRVGASGTPAGTVHLYEGATLIDTETLDGSGKASLLTNSLSLGMQTLHVAYDGAGSDDPTDSGHFTITFTAPPPPPMCVANGTLKVSPGVTSAPSTVTGGLAFKGTLTGCNNFGSFTSRYPITAGTVTLAIKGLNPGATCGSLDTGPGAKYSAKLAFAFKGINPKTGKLATATVKTKVTLVSFTEQPSPFGHTAVSVVVADPKGKNPFIGHSATLTIAYDETPSQISASCASKSGLKSLHFGSVVDHKVMWSPVNGPSTLELGN